MHQSMFENYFLSDVHHSLQEIRSEWGGAKGLRQPNGGQISRIAGRTVDGNEFPNALKRNKAFPVK